MPPFKLVSVSVCCVTNSKISAVPNKRHFFSCPGPAGQLVGRCKLGPPGLGYAGLDSTFLIRSGSAPHACILSPRRRAGGFLGHVISWQIAKVGGGVASQTPHCPLRPELGTGSFAHIALVKASQWPNLTSVGKEVNSLHSSASCREVP